MTWTNQGNIVALNADKTAGSTSITSGAQTTYTPVVGDVIVVTIALDNQDTTQGVDSTLVTSVTDTKGNTYTKLREYTAGRGAVLGGVTLSTWACLNVTSAWASTDTITANHGSTTARAIRAAAYTPSNANGATVDPTTNAAVGIAADPASMTLTPAGGNKAYLWLYFLGFEGPASDTDTADAANGWTRNSFNATSGGGAASNVGMTAAFQAATAASKTADWTHTADDYSQIMVALIEAPIVTRVNITPGGAGQITFTGQTVTASSGATTTTVDVSTAGAIQVSGQAVGISTRTDVATAGAITFTGQSVPVRLALNVGTAGAITFTGQAVGISTRSNVATAGVITFTGQAVGISTRTDVGTAGAIQVTGQAVGLKVTANVTTAGQITVTGQAVGIGGTTTTTVNVDTPGAVTITGQSVGLRITANVTAAGAITLSGQSTPLRVSATVAGGLITVTGQAVGLLRVITPSAGQITVSGQALALRTFLALQPGAITFTGGDVQAGVFVATTAAEHDDGGLSAQWDDGEATGEAAPGAVTAGVSSGSSGRE